VAVAELRRTQSLTVPAVGGAAVPSRRDVFHAGALLDGRYRLVRWISEGATALWRAEDEVLARPVAVRLLDTATAPPGAVADFLAAAAAAGRVTSPHVASVYDAAEDRAAQMAYVVAEWAEGTALDVVLRDGPLPPARAAAVVLAACAGLAAAHDRDVFAGRLHPADVILGPAGGVKVTDLEVGAAVHGVPVPPDPVQADTEELGRVLYAALTGRWPRAEGDATAVGLPDAPTSSGRLCLPRQVLAGVPRELDAVVARVLDPLRRPTEPPLRTPAALAAALRPLAVAEAVPDSDADRPARAARRPRRGVRPALLLLLLAVVALAGWLTGLRVGRVPDAAQPARRVVPGLAAPAPLDLAAVSAFDPLGDRAEGDSSLDEAHDQDPTTSWETERYTSPAFGGLKTGVGVLVDLGSPAPVSKVSLTVPAGEQLQLYAAPTATAPPAALTDLSAVTGPTDSAADPATSTDLVPRTPTTSRYWLVWLTRLPPASSGGGFRGSIAEMAFFR